MVSILPVFHIQQTKRNIMKLTHFFLRIGLCVVMTSFVCIYGQQELLETSDLTDTSSLVDQSEQVQDFQIIDEIVVIIYGKERNAIITRSDIQRPGLNGEKRELDEIIFQELVALDAHAHNIQVSDEEGDRDIDGIQRDNNLTRENLEQIFASSGYTFAEGKAFFKKMKTVSMMLDFKVRSNLMVRRKDIQAYYDAHPEYVDAQYLISRAVVADKTVDEVKACVKKPSCSKHFSWSSPFWIADSEIAQEKSFIKTMPLNELLVAGETMEGVELYKLLEKKERRLREFDERYHEIARLLQKPQYEKLMNQYKDSLMKQMAVVHL